MNSMVRAKLEEICERRWNGRGRVLEIGAIAEDDSFLDSHVFSRADERIGINLDVPRKGHNFQIVEGNANDMHMFESDSFDLVISNALLEHDPMFWRTLQEARRVAKPGALIVIGVPGFTDIRWLKQMQRIGRKLGMRRSSRLRGLLTSTMTFRVHNDPGDYYRFSEQAMAQVLLADCADVETESILLPPRIVGSGYLSSVTDG